MSRASTRSATRPAVVALVAIIIAVTAALIRTPGRATAEAGAVGTSGVVTPAPAPVSQPAPVPDKVTMEITPDEQIWVAATADGEPAVFRMLQAGERVTLTAARELRFRIGNASAFKFSINGAAGKPLGAAGEVKEFQVTPENYRTFVR
jgi:hypothetical protein